MSRVLWTLCLTGILFGLTHSTAEAQLHRGDVRLYLDTQFVSWNSFRVRAEQGNADFLSKANTTQVGLLGVGGLGLAYVVSPYIVPGLYFSLQHASSRVEEHVGNRDVERSAGRSRQWELRPHLEVPFNASSRFVVHAMAGVSLMREVREGPDTTQFGVGPVVGLGAHGFVTSRLSLDVALAFRAAFVKNDDLKEALEVPLDDVRLRSLAVLFTIGASYWL